MQHFESRETGKNVAQRKKKRQQTQKYLTPREISWLDNAYSSRSR